MTAQAEIAAFRFGYGLPLPQGAPVEGPGLLAQLAGPDPALTLWPGPDAAAVMALHAHSIAARDLARKTPPKSPERKAHGRVLREVRAQEDQILRLTLARALDSPDGLRERLVWFWADHFTALPRLRDQRGVTVSRIDHAIRPHVAGRFIDLLQAAELHPSMLIALDQVASVGPNSPAGQKRGAGLNENLAREMIELHTMGVGAGYQQQDVRELAELLTGLDLERGQGTIFTPRRAEPGAETVLGKTYGPEGLEPILAVMADLARRPETAQHLARKLVVHFLSDSPDEALVAQMAKAYLEADTALLPMIEVMLNAPQSWAMPLAKARHPFDFMVASLRGLGLDGAAVLALSPKPFRRMIRDPMQVMGQDWDAPRGPDGWPEETEAWITPQGLAARIAWAMEMPAKLLPGANLPDPGVFAARVLGALGSETEIGLWAARAEATREGIGLVLSSPQFNRR